MSRYFPRGDMGALEPGLGARALSLGTYIPSNEIKKGGGCTLANNRLTRVGQAGAECCGQVHNAALFLAFLLPQPLLPYRG